MTAGWECACLHCFVPIKRILIYQSIYQDFFVCVQFFSNMNPRAMFTDTNILLMLLMSLVFSSKRKDR